MKIELIMKYYKKMNYKNSTSGTKKNNKFLLLVHFSQPSFNIWWNVKLEYWF